MSFPPPPPPPPPQNGHNNASRLPAPPPPPGSQSLIQQRMTNQHITPPAQQQNRNASAYGFQGPPQQLQQNHQPPSQRPPPSVHSQQNSYPQSAQPQQPYSFPPPSATIPYQQAGHGYPRPPSQQLPQQPLSSTDSELYRRPLGQGQPSQYHPMQQQQQYQQTQRAMTPPPPSPYGKQPAVAPPPPSPYGKRSYNARPPPPPGPVNGMPPPLHNSFGSGRPPPPPPNYGGRPPTPNAPQGQQSQQYNDSPKIDLSQIPRPPLFTRPNDNGHLPIYSTKAAAAQTRIAPPPPADSRFLVNDDGNASPQLIRSNMYTIPLDRGTYQKMGELDMGLVCSPLALPSQDYSPTMGPQPDGNRSHEKATLDPQRIPIIQPTTGSDGKSLPPPRCRHCQAYMNPYWDSSTNACNFCGSKNDNIDFDVTCLQKGTVDFVVDGPYITRASPVQPIFLYALDLTCPRVMDYIDMLGRVGRDLAKHFQQQPAQQRLVQERLQEEHSDYSQEKRPIKPLLQQQRPRIGLCFVASFGIVVLTKNGPQDTLQATIMPDVTEDPYCHSPLTEWTFDLSTPEGVNEWMQHIQQSLLEGDILTHLRYEAKKRNAYGLDGYELSCGGAAMAFCADALVETGGRATWISHRRPTFGAGSIRHRGMKAQSRVQPGVQDGMPLQDLTNPSDAKDEAAGIFYRKLQDKCNKIRVVLDVVIHSNPDHVMFQSLDLATQSEVCRATCGKLTWLSSPGEGWKEPLLEELRRPLLSFQGWDSVFKVRCSAGLDVKGFMSHPGVTVDGGGLSTSPELELSCVTPQTSLAVVLEHKIGGVPKNASSVYVQSALLYSTLSGQRRVRVSTLCLRPSTDISNIFLSIDFSALITLYLRRAVARLRDSAKTKAVKEDVNAWHRQAREDIINQIVHLFTSYRQHTKAIQAPPGQLILPEKLQLLPLFGMCLMKSPMFRPSLPRRLGNAVVVSPTNDERAFYSFQASMVGPSAAMLMVHPYLFPIRKPLDSGVGEWLTPAGEETAISELGQASYHSHIQLPPSINASMTCLEDDGVYLIDTGLVIYLFFGKEATTEIKKELSHVPSSPQLSSFEEPTEYGKRVRRLVWQLRSFCSVGSEGSRSQARPVFAPVIPVWQGDSRHQMFEQDIMNWMVDDPNSGEKDYADFLCKLHRLIRDKMNPGAKSV